MPTDDDHDDLDPSSHYIPADDSDHPREKAWVSPFTGPLRASIGGNDGFTFQNADMGRPKRETDSLRARLGGD